MMQKHSIARAIAGARWNPRDGLIGNDQGLWLDPSDLTTMFQDAAGTVPVTAVAQPVGLMLDKSGRGNHAYQTTSTKRPVLSARVNLCEKSEFPSGTADTQLSLGFASSTLTGYAGALVCANLSGPAYAYKTTGLPTTAGTYRIRAVVKMADSLAPSLPSTDPASALNDFSFVIGGLNAAATLGAEISPGVFEVYGSIFTSAENNGRYGIQRISGGVRRAFTITAYSVVPADQAYLPYQRVNTATDYDTVGFPTYLKFDGIDDAMQTNSIDFSATDEITVAAGVRKVGTYGGTLIELSSDYGKNLAFALFAPSTLKDAYGFRTKGSTPAVILDANGSQPSPISNVVTGVANISDDVAVVRINGAHNATSNADQGTGNYGNYPLYIGARAGTSLFFNGHLYQLVICGRPTTVPIDQIVRTEEFVNRKTKAY